MSRLDVEIEVRKVASMVGTARRLMATGTMVDLSELEGKVAGLCAAIEALPREEGRGLVGDLETLLSNLDRLAADIEAQHGRIHGGEQMDPR